MPAPIRLALLGLALIASTGGRCLGQFGLDDSLGSALAVAQTRRFDSPFWGYNRPVGDPASIASEPSPITGGNSSIPGLGIVGPVPRGVDSYRPWAGSGFFVMVPGLSPPPPAQAGPGGLWLSRPAVATAEVTATPRPRSNPARAAELVVLGDRAFRGGNYRKAEERYVLASRADADAPVPHVRLAQVAIVRASYPGAAARFREAVQAGEGSGWLIDAPDVQSLFGEPREFARRISLLESHLQAHPEDRDAWFVLGAERYLSGHPREAYDALARLDARSADAALLAFQDAATVALRSLARGDDAHRDDR